VVEVAVPGGYRHRVVTLLARLQTLALNVDVPARVVVNERTGTIVVGENVRLREVALAHGNLHIRIIAETQVSQPRALSAGSTAVVEQRDVNVSEEPGRLIMMPEGVSLGDVVNALNAIGVTSGTRWPSSSPSRRPGRGRGALHPGPSPGRPQRHGVRGVPGPGPGPDEPGQRHGPRRDTRKGLLNQMEQAGQICSKHLN
jgi:hypothetical protein